MLRSFIRTVKEHIQKKSIYVFNTILSKLILMYFLIIVLPVILISVFLFNSYLSFTEKKVEDSILKNLAQITNNMDNYIGEIEKLSLVIYSNDEIQRALKLPQLQDNKKPAYEMSYKMAYKDDLLSSSKVIYSYFIDLMSSRDDILGVCIFCENGQVYKTSRGEYIDNIHNFKQTSWYKAIVNNEGSIIFTENILKKYFRYNNSVITFCRAIKDSKTFTNLGAIVFTLDIGKIRSMAVKSPIDDDTRILITNGDGRIIYYTNEELINKVVVNNFYMDVLYKDYGRIATNLNGDEYMVFFNTSHYTGWKVAQILNKRMFYKDIYNLKIGSFSLVFFIITAIIILIYVSSAITRPLKTLTHAMSSVNEGNMDIKVNISSSDEVGILSRTFNAMIDRINSLIANVYSARIKQKEAELNALQSQINPHFLYNTLEMIGNIAVIEDVELIAKITNCMGKMFRYTISNKEEVVTIKDEINHVKNYMEIQKLRFSNRFDIIFDVNDNVESCIIPKLLLQPLVENAVYHGLETKTGNGIIIVTVNKVNNDEIEICVKDNGKGIDEETLKTINKSLKENYNYLSTEGNKRRGFALININMRIAIFFGEKYGMKVESNIDNGTKVTMRIPALDTPPKDYLRGHN